MCAGESVGEPLPSTSNMAPHALTPPCCAHAYARIRSCPSRAEFLSGRYFHNIRETTPSGGCMHVDDSKVVDFMYAYYIEKAGYNVGYFGKNLNACPTAAPPGFDCPDCYWFANGGGKDSEPGGYLNASFHDRRHFLTRISRCRASS